MFENISNALLTINPLEAISVVCSLAYVYFAAKDNILCWYFALVATALAIYLFWDAKLLMESALNVYYFLIAIYGWWQWRYGGQNKDELTIQSWRWSRHIITIVLIIALTLFSGYLLSKNTQAALPYVDSFTTWSAVITTWMVTRKILENWLYWIVIDAVCVWLYFARDLQLYATLSFAYTIIAIAGYWQWHKKYHALT